MRTLATLSTLATVSLLVAGCAHGPRTAVNATAVTTSIEPFTSNNPFAKASTLPFGAPPFDRIHDADYEPAIDAGMRQHLAEVEAIANQTAPPTFDNTIAALERSGDLLTRVLKVFNGITASNTDDTLQAI